MNQLIQTQSQQLNQLKLPLKTLFNPDFPLGFVMMADALFEAVLVRMRRQ